MKLKDLKKVRINKIEPTDKLYIIQVDVRDNTLSEACDLLKNVRQVFTEKGVSNAIYVAGNKVSIKELVDPYVEKLENENKELRERLSKSLELPYMEHVISNTGTCDTILYYMEDGKLQQECFNDAFPEQLEKRLEELRNR